VGPSRGGSDFTPVVEIPAWPDAAQLPPFISSRSLATGIGSASEWQNRKADIRRGSNQQQQPLKVACTTAGPFDTTREEQAAPL
jgi:hypothetical protein